MGEAVHASAVSVGEVGILIRGRSGAGKSQLALALMDKGAWLVADDRVYLASRAGRLIGSAPAPIAGLVELRGRGILPRPFHRQAIIRLVVDIVAEGPLERMPHPDELETEVLGVTLPRQPVAGADNHGLLLVSEAVREIGRAHV